MNITMLFFSLLLSISSIFGQADLFVPYVGVAKANITPIESVYLAGYNRMYSNRVSNEIHDSLYCRVTVLEVAEKRLVIISSDLIGMYEVYDFFKEALMRKFSLKPEEILLSCIHTHSGPILTFSEEHKNTSNYRYTQKFKEQLLNAVGEAIVNMRPCRIEVNQGYSPIGINRRVLKLNPNEWPYDGGLIKMGRNPNGIVDNEVLVLKITGVANTLNCCLFNYACHARTQNHKSKVITGDFMGISEQVAEKNLTNNTIVSAFAGASGEIDPIYVLEGIDKEFLWTPETELLGTLLGQEVVRTYRGATQKIQLSQVKTELLTIQLPVKNVGEYVSNDKLPKQALNITIASLGEIAIIGLGCEPSVEIGLAIKKASPYKYNFIIAHCNGAAGYLMPKYLYKERGYEVSVSPFGPESADIVVKEILAMLYKQHNK